MIKSSNFPPEWAKIIEDVLCRMSSSSAQDTCALQIDCQTLTTLSDYVQDGTMVTITFVAEDGISYKRSLDVGFLVGYLFDDIDSTCIGVSKTDWLNMSFKQRIESIISDVNQCCVDATSTTTTSTSTTTTTTEASTTTTTTEESTTTTTTEEPTTTTTTTTTSTTTTTTQAFTVRVTNSLPGTTVTDVNNTPGFNIFIPVGVGDIAEGFHNAFTGSVQMIIDGPPIFNGNAALEKDGVLIDCVAVTTGGVYPMTINFISQSYFLSHVIHVSLNIGSC